MARPPSDSTVLTLRIPAALDRQLAREARRRRRTRSEIARAILEAEFAAMGPDLAAEARRQSLLVRSRRSERDTLKFFLDAAAGDPALR
jgi:predicted transcriptional regulator